MRTKCTSTVIPQINADKTKSSNFWHIKGDVEELFGSHCQTSTIVKDVYNTKFCTYIISVLYKTCIVLCKLYLIQFPPFLKSLRITPEKIIWLKFEKNSHTLYLKKTSFPCDSFLSCIFTLKNIFEDSSSYRYKTKRHVGTTHAKKLYNRKVRLPRSN